MAKKIKDLYTILTFDQANTHLYELAKLQRELDDLKNAAQEEIDSIKDQLGTDSKPVTTKIKKHTASLERFCKANKAEFTKRKSKKLMFGIVGFRASSSITCKNTAVAKIQEFFKRRAKYYLHIKKEPDKVALNKLDNETLRKLDCSKKRKIEFYAEPDLIEIEKHLHEPQ